MSHSRKGTRFSGLRVSLNAPREAESRGTVAPGLRHAVLFVAMANFFYFFVEFAVAKRIGSVSLFADSIDFLEDTSVNLLVFVALKWSMRSRARLGMALAGFLLVPAIALVWTAWQKLLAPVPPEPWLLSTTGLGALAVNLVSAFLLTRYRNHGGSLTRAAFLSARNDAFANLAIIATGIVTLYLWKTGWPDLIVGIGIIVLNLDAAREIWAAARKEHIFSGTG